MSFSFNYPNTSGYILATSSVVDISAIIINGPIPDDTIFKINPILPIGLNIDASNGTILGNTTFSSISPLKTYTVDASGSTTVVSSTLKISVNFLPVFYYVLSPYILKENQTYYPTSAPYGPRPTTLISNVPGIVYSLISPSSLPSGMVLDDTTGNISGTPSGFSLETVYTIRANNGGIIYDASLNISVQTLPVITYPQSIYILTQGIPFYTEPIAYINNGDVIYAISGCSLPIGLSFNDNTGAISGTPLLPTTYRQYTVYISNTIGSSTINLTINVIKTILAPPVIADDINAGACLTDPDAAMRRKAEILKYKNNSAGFTKNQNWSLAVQGKGPYAKRAWGNQNTIGSNPNISGLPTQGTTIICNSTSVVCTPTSSSNVPGPIMNLCYNRNIPLIGYGQPNRRRVDMGFKWPQATWQPGDNGFPVGKAGNGNG
jgi:hypothetical protein